MSDGNLSHRSSNLRQTERVDRVQEVYQMYLQHIPIAAILEIYNRKYPAITERTLYRYLSRGRKLFGLKYEKNIEELTELSMARRYATIDQCWKMIHILVDPMTQGWNLLDIDKRSNAVAKLMQVIDINQKAIEQFLRVRQETGNVNAGTLNQDNRSVIVLTGRDEADRISAITKLLDSKVVDEPKHDDEKI